MESHVYIGVHLYMYVYFDMVIVPKLSMMYPTFARMGWLRLVGSIKLQVSFAEYSLFYRALLQERPEIFIGPTDQSHPI